MTLYGLVAIERKPSHLGYRKDHAVLVGLSDFLQLFVFLVVGICCAYSRKRALRTGQAGLAIIPRQIGINAKRIPVSVMHFCSC